ncbi:MAG: type II toxin-antitoxin system RelE/ParE family toxin [Nitrospirales bacterium]|nr:type II toxin-antitoxin system RelE/ParE family toxin [Nitrospira sp.]MDR4500958.1 type II toxin-antitoxin system RelE/ParE family toxin [Nitrospirales bacterium]
MEYKLTQEAYLDSQNIYEYGFYTFGETQAEAYADELDHCFELLTQTPLICRKRSEFTPSVRIYQHKSHQIIYTVEDHHILIVRILHKSMNPSRHLSSTQ